MICLSKKGKSNPFIHLLAAPYIKNVRENNGEDLPTLDDLQVFPYFRNFFKARYSNKSFTY